MSIMLRDWRRYVRTPVCGSGMEVLNCKPYQYRVYIAFSQVPSGKITCVVMDVIR